MDLGRCASIIQPASEPVRIRCKSDPTCLLGSAILVSVVSLDNPLQSALKHKTRKKKIYWIEHKPKTCINYLSDAVSIGVSFPSCSVIRELKEELHDILIAATATLCVQLGDDVLFPKVNLQPLIGVLNPGCPSTCNQCNARWNHKPKFNWEEQILKAQVHCRPHSACILHSLQQYHKVFHHSPTVSQSVPSLTDSITKCSITHRQYHKVFHHSPTVSQSVPSLTDSITKCSITHPVSQSVSHKVFHHCHSPTVSQSVPSLTDSITKCSITHRQYHKVFHHSPTVSQSVPSLTNSITKCSITHRQYHKVFHHSPTVSQSVPSLTNSITKCSITHHLISQMFHHWSAISQSVPSLTDGITVFHHSPTVSLSQQMLPSLTTSINKSKMFHHSPTVALSVPPLTSNITKYFTGHHQYH